MTYSKVDENLPSRTSTPNSFLVFYPLNNTEGKKRVSSRLDLDIH